MRTPHTAESSLSDIASRADVLQTGSEMASPEANKQVCPKTGGSLAGRG